MSSGRTFASRRRSQLFPPLGCDGHHKMVDLRLTKRRAAEPGGSFAHLKGADARRHPVKTRRETHDPQDTVRYRHRRRYRRRGTHPDPSFSRWRLGWLNGWWNGWWLSRPRTLGRRLRRHRGDWTELLAVGARPRQGLCLLLIDLDYFSDTTRPWSCYARPGPISTMTV